MRTRRPSTGNQGGCSTRANAFVGDLEAQSRFFPACFSSGECNAWSRFFSKKKTTDLLIALHQAADRARHEACHHDTDPITPLYIRARNSKSVHSFYLFFAHSDQFHCRVSSAMRVSHAKNTVLKSAVFSKVVEEYKQDGNLAAIHPCTRFYKGPDEDSATPQLTPCFHKMFVAILCWCSTWRMLRAWATNTYRQESGQQFILVTCLQSVCSGCRLLMVKSFNGRIQQ